MIHDQEHLSTGRLQRAAERLRLRGLEAEERGHTNLASLCWQKRVEALSQLTTRAAEDARVQHRYRGRRMERVF